MLRLLRCAAVLLLSVRLALPPDAHAFSIGEERLLGERLLYAVRGELNLLDDPDIAQYINRLGAQVLETAGPQYFDYHFFVVKNDQFNAFAAPSGLIFFNTGLLQTMKSEDQLVSVMAHEIGHVVSRHIASRMAKETKVTAVSMLFALASLAAGNPALTQAAFTTAMAAGATAGLKFSREDEEQADRLAVDWLRGMGRDPLAMEGMLKTMRRITRYSSEQLPPYLLTHPNPEDRLHYVQDLTGSHQGAAAVRKKDNFDFFRFKYRVLSQALEPDEMRRYCASVLAADKDPEEVKMARYGLALVSAEEKDFASAVRMLDAVRQSCPEKYALNVDLASLYLASGRHSQALELLRRAHLRDPLDMHAAFHLAQALEQDGEDGEAERLYLEVAKAMPEYSQLYYELGGLNARKGQNGVSKFYLAKYYLYEGRMKEAEQQFERSAKDETLPEPLRSEAKEILDRLKKLEDA
jgi:predicted Zn-dependent protease